MMRYTISLTLPSIVVHCAAGDSIGSYFLAQSATANTTLDANNANLSSQGVAALSSCRVSEIQGSDRWRTCNHGNMHKCAGCLLFGCKCCCNEGFAYDGHSTCATCSAPSPPPVTNYPPRATPSFSCDTACFFKGEWYTCRERINWLVGRGQNQWQATSIVNSECQGQCSCSHGSFPNPTPRPPAGNAPVTICPAGYTATTQNVDGSGKQWSNHGDIQGCADRCTNRHGCDVFEYAVSGGEKTKCGTYTSGHTISGTQHSGWQTCSKSWTPPTPPSMDKYPPSISCDQACFFKGEWHTCRDRVTWLLGHGQLQWEAIRTVNVECQSQCACSHDHFRSAGHNR